MADMRWFIIMEIKPFDKSLRFSRIHESFFSVVDLPCSFQGTADGFLSTQLKPENFAAAAASVGYPCQVREAAKKNPPLMAGPL